MEEEIYRLELDTEVTDITTNQDEDVLTIKTKKGDVVIQYYHEQDCCENVYADFSVIKYHKAQISDFTSIYIKSVKEIGFLLCFTREYHGDYKIVIPCYNSQNGYYSKELDLIIKYNNKETRIDITDSVTDNSY